MEKEMEDRMKRFLLSRTYASVLAKREETSSLMDAVMDYGAEKVTEENPYLAVAFPLKLCAIKEDDIGRILCDQNDVGKKIPGYGSEILEKMCVISSEIMSFYADIPKDRKMKINFKGVGGTPFYGSSPEKSDLVHCEEGLHGNVSVEDGKALINLGPANGADYEISAPTPWVIKSLFGVVPPSDIEGGAGEYAGYMGKALSNIANIVLEKYPQYVFMRDEWVSRVNEEWNSDEEKMNSLKVSNGTILMTVEGIDPSTTYPKDTMDALLRSLDPMVKKGIDEEHKIRIFLEWEGGKVEMRVLKPDEEVLPDGTIITDHETIMRIAHHEDTIWGAYRRKNFYLKVKGKTQINNVMSVYDGLVWFVHCMLDGSLILIPDGGDEVR